MGGKALVYKFWPLLYKRAELDLRLTKQFVTNIGTNKYVFYVSVFYSEGDPVQFEAVPQEGNADDPASSYCSWFATLVWKGKRPTVEPYSNDSPYSTVTAASSGALQQVKGLLEMTSLKTGYFPTSVGRSSVRRILQY